MLVALIGLGDIGLSAHLPALKRHPEIEIVMVADASAERRAAAGRRSPHYQIGTGIDDVLAAGVDGVVLATPPWVTPDLAVRAARAGLYVLAEKPVATSVEAAAVYAELSVAERARVQVGLSLSAPIRRFRPWPEGCERRSRYTAAGASADLRRATPTRRTPSIPSECSPRSSEDAGDPSSAHVFDWLSHLLQGLPGTDRGAWSVRTAAHLPAPNLVGATLFYPRRPASLSSSSAG